MKSTVMRDTAKILAIATVAGGVIAGLLTGVWGMSCLVVLTGWFVFYCADR